MSKHTRLLLDKSHELQAAYKLLKPFVDDDRYHAYLCGLLDAIGVLQKAEREASSAVDPLDDEQERTGQGESNG